MKRGEVFFHPMEGSGQLGISWSSAPKEAAVEAKKGNGVGFFSTNGNLLSVIFDDVLAAEDHQVLEFASYRVEIFTKRGKVTHSIHKTDSKLLSSKTRISRKQHSRPKRRSTKTLR
jgi:hypothetical protein